MRIEGSVTSVSWIPSEAVAGMTKGCSRSDSPTTTTPHRRTSVPTSPPRWRPFERRIGSDSPTILAPTPSSPTAPSSTAGYLGGGQIGATTVRLGKRFTVAAVGLPDRQHEPEMGDGWVRFTQSAGGRTGFPAPRAVRRPPYVQYFSPIAWSTLELTLHADGHSESRLVGASSFPRHWVYDNRGALTAKSGLIDYNDWAGRAFGKHTPWGDEESPALVTTVETALERQLSAVMMHGDAKPAIRKLKEGATLTEQGAPGGELFLLLDGVVVVEVDGSAAAEVGPGAVLGERAELEGGARTSTLRARTACRVAAVPFDAVDRDQLVMLSADHRREEKLGEG